MKKNPALILGATIITLISLAGGYFFATGKGKMTSLGMMGKSVSPNILYITNPVNNISGKIEKISGKSLWISQQYLMAQTGSNLAIVPPIQNGKPQTAQPIVFPTPMIKTVTYKVNVTDKTQFNKPSVFVNYLLKTVTPAPPPKVTIADLKAGQIISVTTTADLRMVTSDEVEATSIQLNSVTNTINGKISKIERNTIWVKASLSLLGPGPIVADQPPPTPKEMEYTVTVTDDTEISRYGQPEPFKEGVPPKPPTPEKLSLSDLKVDMQVTVYTDTDVSTTTKFTALRIEPFMMIVPPAGLINPPVIPPSTDSANRPPANP